MNSQLPLDRRWLVGAIVAVTVIGAICFIAFLYSPKASDAALLAAMAGFLGTALAGLLAALKGADIVRELRGADEKITRIDHAVNGDLDRRIQNAVRAALAAPGQEPR